jgi:hypothetical protein
MDLSSAVSAPSGFISEPPLSPGAAPPIMASNEQPANVPPPAGGGPSLEAQVVRLGLMTPDDVATTMREEAETGRPFAELAVESGRLKAEDLATLTGETPKPLAVALEPTPAEESTPAPVSIVPDLEPLELDSEPEPELIDEPSVAIVPNPEPEPEEDLELESSAPTEIESESAEVFVCLTSGERVAAGSFDGQDAAEARARELMRALDGEGEWPRLDGRFIRPDAVVSIDVELSDR